MGADTAAPLWDGSAGASAGHGESAECGLSCDPVFPGFARTSPKTEVCLVSLWAASLKRSSSKDCIISRIWSLDGLWFSVFAWMSNRSVVTHSGSERTKPPWLSVTVTLYANRM
jgi:hypothetical protein